MFYTLCINFFTSLQQYEGNIEKKKKNLENTDAHSDYVFLLILASHDLHGI